MPERNDEKVIRTEQSNQALTYRKLDASDYSAFEQILAIYQEPIIAAHLRTIPASVEVLMEETVGRENVNIFAAFNEQGRVISTLVLGLNPSGNPGVGEIRRVATAAAHRGNGAGAYLFSAVLAEHVFSAQGYGLASVDLRVMVGDHIPEHEGTIGFYEKFGFRKRGKMENDSNRWEKDVLHDGGMTAFDQPKPGESYGRRIVDGELVTVVYESEDAVPMQLSLYHWQEKLREVSSQSELPAWYLSLDTRGLLDQYKQPQDTTRLRFAEKAN